MILQTSIDINQCIPVAAYFEIPLSLYDIMEIAIHVYEYSIHHYYLGMENIHKKKTKKKNKKCPPKIDV